ncbi:MAG TPA: head GIN domain-containing protein [Prolixibacteraceae bacterium]
MKTTFTTAFFLLALLLTGTRLQAEEQTRKVDSFTEISLRIGANVHLEQGNKQSLEIEAKSSTLEELITEVKDGKLIIRFPNKNMFWNTFQPGEITIHITMPEVNALGVSGSGDIIAEDPIKTKEIDLAVSGSGNIKLEELSAQRVKSAISGSGNIVLAGKETAQDLSIVISGSGNFKGMDYSANDVTVKLVGSGNVGIEAKNNLYIRLAGSGNVTYKGKPSIDQSTTGSGSVRSSR